MSTVRIDPTVANDAVGGRVNRFAVKVDNNTLYVFFATANGASANDYAYRKSVDGGATWSAEVACGAPVGHLSSYHDNYYNRWNNPAASNIVHLFRIEAAGINAFYGGYYRQLNLDTDTLSAETLVFALGIPAAGVGGVGVAQSGRIYTCGAGQGTNRMSYSDDNGVTWHALSVSFCETFNQDELHMWPDYSSADPNDMLCIYFDWSASEVSVKQYDASANTITETSIATGVGPPNPVGAGWRNTASAMAATDNHIRVAAYSQYSNPQTLYTWDVFGN
ncbi:MAG: sialidase family protein, partial [Mycobacterium sp.]|nr:sialidase family protein [Mycobacterium sp.]